MNRVANPSIVRSIGILMIVIAIINIVPAFLDKGPNTERVLDPSEVGGAPAGPVVELMAHVGSFNTPMGAMTLIHAPVMAAIGVALVLLKRWELFAGISLILDILVKFGVILSLLAIGRNLAEAATIPLLFIIVEGIAAYTILRQWQLRKRSDPTERTSAMRSSSVTQHR